MKTEPQIDKTFKPFTLHDVLDAYERRRAHYATEKNPHHRKILRNYLVHAALEVSGRCDEIFDPALTIEEPEYEYFQMGTQYHGANAVRDLYGELMSNDATAIIANRQKIAVADWGFCTEQVNNYYMPAEMAQRRGIPAIDGNLYVEHRPVAMVWYYSPEAKLEGERLYHATHSTYSVVTEEQYLHTTGIRNTLSSFIERAMQEYLDNPDTLPEPG